MFGLLIRFVDYVFYHNVTQILMYHGFCQFRNEQLNTGKHVPIEDFEQQLKYLCENFNPITLSQFISAKKNKTKLPSRSVILTFDDGFLSNYTLAFPLLKKYKVPAIIYIATDFINRDKLIWTDRVELAIRKTTRIDVGKQLSKITNIEELASSTDITKLTWLTNGWLKQHSDEKKVQLIEQIIKALDIDKDNCDVPEIMRPLSVSAIKEMQCSGLIEFGAHTRTHPILSHCSEEQLEEEIVGSKLDVEKITGKTCIHFAYPNGGEADFNPYILRIIKKTGIESSVTTIMGENNLSTDPHRLKRIGVFQGLTFEQFKANLQPARRKLATLKMRIMGLFHL